MMGRPGPRPRSLTCTCSSGHSFASAPNALSMRPSRKPVETHYVAVPCNGSGERGSGRGATYRLHGGRSSGGFSSAYASQAPAVWPGSQGASAYRSPPPGGVDETLSPSTRSGPGWSGRSPFGVIEDRRPARTHPVAAQQTLAAHAARAVPHIPSAGRPEGTPSMRRRAATSACRRPSRLPRDRRQGAAKCGADVGAKLRLSPPDALVAMRHFGTSTDTNRCAGPPRGDSIAAGRFRRRVG
jgi:hypothetical protein